MLIESKISKDYPITVFYDSLTGKTAKLRIQKHILEQIATDIYYANESIFMLYKKNKKWYCSINDDVLNYARQYKKLCEDSEHYGLYSEIIDEHETYFDVWAVDPDV